MKLLTSLFLLVTLAVPVLAETIRDDYTAKLEALKKLEGQARAVVNPSGDIVFPQIANGSFQGTLFITSIVLSNNTTDPVPVTLAFKNEFGGAMVLSLFDSPTGGFVETASSFALTIPPAETLFLETNGLGGLVTGWDRATSFGNSTMGGVAAFQLLDTATLQFLPVVGVGASDASRAFFTPVFKDDALKLQHGSGYSKHLQLYGLRSNIPFRE